MLFLCQTMNMGSVKKNHINVVLELFPYRSDFYKKKEHKVHLPANKSRRQQI